MSHRIEIIPLDQLTSVVLDIGGASELRENVSEIEEIIWRRYGISYRIGYLFDKRNMPPLLNFWCEEKERVMKIHEATRELCVEGGVCFTFPKGLYNPCFDLIDYILEYDVFRVCGNVTRMSIVTNGDEKTLFIGYDALTAPLS